MSSSCHSTHLQDRDWERDGMVPKGPAWVSSESGRETHASSPAPAYLVAVEGGAEGGLNLCPGLALLPSCPAIWRKGRGSAPTGRGLLRGPTAAGVAPRSQTLCVRAGSKLEKDRVGCGGGS